MRTPRARGLSGAVRLAASGTDEILSVPKPPPDLLLERQKQRQQSPGLPIPRREEACSAYSEHSRLILLGRGQPAECCAEPHFLGEAGSDRDELCSANPRGPRRQRPDNPAIGSNVDTAKPSARFARINGSLRSSHSRALFRPSSNSSWRNSGDVLNLLEAS